MDNKIWDTHPELWHYTTATGLIGILNSRQLWATNIYFLNDAEEYSGFFDYRLSNIARSGIDEALKSFSKTNTGQELIRSKGGLAPTTVWLESLVHGSMRRSTHASPAYITSFCPAISDSGMLSQWRGYGQDGGYAIVFRTKELSDLLQKEASSYQYMHFFIGNVDYFDAQRGLLENHIETLEREKVIRNVILRMLSNKSLSESDADQLAEATFSLASRHKHSGFQEEREIRISAVLSDNETILRYKDRVPNLPEKPIRFISRGGVLIPYIALFESISDDLRSLPISKIVVGPHPDKTKRQRSVEAMLKELNIDAPVVASDIPYIGHHTTRQ